MRVYPFEWVFCGVYSWTSFLLTISHFQIFVYFFGIASLSTPLTLHEKNFKNKLYTDKWTLQLLWIMTLSTSCSSFAKTNILVSSSNPRSSHYLEPETYMMIPLVYGSTLQLHFVHMFQITIHWPYLAYCNVNCL